MPTSSSTNSNSRGLHLERAEGGHKRHIVGLFQPLVWNQARRLLINRPEMLDGVREGVWRTDEEGLVGIRMLPRPPRPPPSILRHRGVSCSDSLTAHFVLLPRGTPPLVRLAPPAAGTGRWRGAGEGGVEAEWEEVVETVMGAAVGDWGCARRQRAN